VKQVLSNAGLRRDTAFALQTRQRQNTRGRQTVNAQTANPSTSQPVFVRPSRFEVEPAVFALTVVALVMSICAWNPQPQAQQVAPADHSSTLAQAPRQ
jgi:hypothetical protein